MADLVEEVINIAMQPSPSTRRDTISAGGSWKANEHRPRQVNGRAKVRMRCTVDCRERGSTRAAREN